MKLKLIKSLVNSALLYGCESWILDQSSAKKLKAYEMKAFRRLLGITWKQRKMNEYVWRKLVEEDVETEPEKLLVIIKRRKLKFFGHQIRAGRMTKVLIQGNVNGKRLRANWFDDLKGWSELGLNEMSRRAEDRRRWREDVSQWVHLPPD